MVRYPLLQRIAQPSSGFPSFAAVTICDESFVCSSSVFNEVIEYLPLLRRKLPSAISIDALVKVFGQIGDIVLKLFLLPGPP